jgi:hypothetical protein
MLKTARQTTDLLFSEFKLLLHEHGLTTAENSPLSSLLDVEPEGDLAALEIKGMLDKEGDWHDALIAISDPDFMTTSVLAFTGMAASSSHFVNRANSKIIVGCWPLNDKQLRISFPWEPIDIIANSLSALVVEDRASFSDIKEMRFTPDGFTAFAAATDAIRTVLLASTLQRKQISSFEMPRNKLDEMLQMSADDNAFDARWLVTLFRALTPNSCMSPENKISGKGFQELVEFQLIQIGDDDHWSPTSELMGIASNWLEPLPAIYHEAVTINPDGSKDVVSNMALRGSGPLCLLTFDNFSNDNLGVLLRSMNDDDFWLHLMGQLTPPKAENKPEPKEKTKTDIKRKPAPAPVKKATACSSCGVSIEPGTKFCTSCGTKVIDKPIMPSCPGCGAQITSSNKFCIACGMKL